ncbi:MAG: aminopeptidase P N-terminal domain-containing protein [Bacteroidales bacterium]|nr:aminopeptidase P N-terminal domain-containing protein [Bacteroidales bacterium]
MKNKSVAIINSNDEMPRNGDQTFPYRQNSDFFYLTGIEQEKSVLIISKGYKKEFEEILFILKPEKTLEIWEGHKLTKEEAKTISGIDNIKYISEFKMILQEVMLASETVYLNKNENPKFETPVPYKDIRFINEITEKFPLHNYERSAPLLTELRLQKEPEETELIQKACNITTKAFHRILKFIKPGVQEYEIEAEITAEFLRNGAGGHAYQPIIASGKDNCVLHYVSNDKECKDGDLILMDFGAEYGNYAADTTRTVPVSGKFTDRQKEVYNAVLRVMKKATLLIKPGNTINKVNEEVNRLIEKELVNLGLAKQNEINNKEKRDSVRMKYFMHGNSHFMGLDVHDVGTKDTVFKAGMLMSCEPGIYVEEEGFGIRLENDILVTENGQIDLLADEPVEIEDIERLMNE